MFVTEVFAGTVTMQAKAIAATSTEVFSLDEMERVAKLRIYLKNTGSVALVAAVLQGSMDGDNWATLDGSAITTAFGTLAASAVATYLVLEANLRWKYIKLSLTADTGGTTVVCGLTTVHG